MSITLDELRLQARQRADMENSNFVSDSELASYINSSIAELYDILCEAYGSDYYVESVNITLEAGEDTYDLPDGTLYGAAPAFYELKGVDLQIDSSNFVSLQKFNFNERNRYTDFTLWDIWGVANVRYRLLGNTIKFSPAPDRAATCRLWYVPMPTRLVNGSDELDDLNSYAEYVIVDAAIKMLQKEESDVTVLFAQKQALEKRIRDKSANRDAGTADTISDIYADDSDYFRRNS